MHQYYRPDTCLSLQVVATVGYCLSARMHERSGTIPGFDDLAEFIDIPVDTLINAEIHILKVMGFTPY